MAKTTTANCIALLQDFASLLNAGLSVKESVQLLKTTPNHFSQRVATQLETALSQGQSVADGLAPWLPSAIAAMLRAGEQAHALETALTSAANALTQRRQTLRQLISTLTYPLLVFALALVLLVVIRHHVLLPFAQLKPVSAWPSAGAELYALAQAVERYSAITLTAIIFLALAISYSLKQYTGAWRSTLDRWPGFRLYRLSVSATLLHMLGLMLQQGIAIKTALSLLPDNQAGYLPWQVTRMQQALRQGHDNVADVLNTGLLEAHTLARLQILSRTRQWSTIMLMLSEQTAQTYQQALQRLGKYLHALLMLLTAGLAAKILIGIYAVGSSLALP